MPKLEVCPFCGCKAEVCKTEWGIYFFYKVECTNCHAQTRDMLPSAGSAIEAWNRRSNSSE